jgi:tetratricopeptide (TPR) repeat protein
VAEAEEALRRAPQEAAVRATVAATSYQLSEVLADDGRYAQALERARRARSLLEAALRESPLDAQSTRILLFALNGESRHLWSLGDLEGAQRVREEALRVAEEALRRDPRDRWSQMGVAVAASELGEALFERGDAARAVTRYRDALRIARTAAEEDPRYTFARMQVAAAEYGLGRALLALKPPRKGEACAALERVQAFWRDLHGKGELPPGEAEDLQRLTRLSAGCAR